ncbi:MAG: hypothetical protein GY765_25405 [bacterium]|nr:hypothetical protein [bacterium]
MITLGIDIKAAASASIIAKESMDPPIFRTDASSNGNYSFGGSLNPPPDQFHT